MQQITIPVPEGKRAVQTTDKDGNIIIKWEDADPTRSKSWKEYCENHPIVIEEYRLNSITGDVAIERDEYRRDRPVFLATKRDAETVRALIQLKRLRDEWLNGWEPIWDNDNQAKYCIVLHRDNIVISCFYTECAFLAFPDAGMTIDFRECFRDLIQQAKPFLQ